MKKQSKQNLYHTGSKTVPGSEMMFEFLTIVRNFVDLMYNLNTSSCWIITGTQMECHGYF